LKRPSKFYFLETDLPRDPFADRLGEDLFGEDPLGEDLFGEDPLAPADCLGIGPGDMLLMTSVGLFAIATYNIFCLKMKLAIAYPIITIIKLPTTCFIFLALVSITISPSNISTTRIVRILVVSIFIRKPNTRNKIDHPLRVYPSISLYGLDMVSDIVFSGRYESNMALKILGNSYFVDAVSIW
jgi:hypothetical protein